MYKLKKLLPQSIKNLYHLAQAFAANVIYGFPSRKLKVIGVTGTDGKTTTVQMTARILQEAGKKVALASTINFVIDGMEEKNLSHYTTESAFKLQKFIRQAVKAGCEYLVLETSSHALDQHRVWGVKYVVAVITNVTREHLDYHKTMEKYRAAKLKLFKIVAKNHGTIVANLDMENATEFLNFEVAGKYGYSTKIEKNIEPEFRIKSGMTAEGVEIVKAEKIKLGISNSVYSVFSSDTSLTQDTEFVLQIPGEYNIQNALAATSVALSEGIGMEMIKEALGKIKGVAGRMEAIENELGMHIFVDFALTPNALDKLYTGLFRAKKPGEKIIAVFGSCGDRDKGKRPIMGKVVSRHAEIIILTNDEPYHEDPQQIIEEIAVGIKNKIENQNFFKIVDRRLAIAKALELAQAGDIIAITGMGNLETMVVGDKKIPWNDRKVIEEELAKI